MLFHDRAEAGRWVGAKLAHHAGRRDLVVLGLARGGVPVAFEVAKRLLAPLDVLVVRRLYAPDHPGQSIGAVASGGIFFAEAETVRALGIAEPTLATVALRAGAEIARLEGLYREGRPPLDLGGRLVVLVDDGLATGATLRAAALAVRDRAPARLVVAVPVATPGACESLRPIVDEVLCGAAPRPVHRIGDFYETFTETSDEHIRELLAAADAHLPHEAPLPMPG